MGVERSEEGNGRQKSVRSSETHSPQPPPPPALLVPSSAGPSHTLPQLRQHCHADPARLSGPPDRKRHPAPGPAVQPARPPSPARRATLSATTAGALRCLSTVELRRPPLDRHLQLPLPKAQSHPDRWPIRKGTLHPLSARTKMLTMVRRMDHVSSVWHGTGHVGSKRQLPLTTSSFTRTCINLRWPFLFMTSSTLPPSRPKCLPGSWSLVGDLLPASCLGAASRGPHRNWEGGH